MINKKRFEKVNNIGWQSGSSITAALLNQSDDYLYELSDEIVQAIGNYESLLSRFESHAIIPQYSNGIELATIGSDENLKKLYMPDLGLVIKNGVLCAEFEEE